MKNINFDKIEKETIAKFKEPLTKDNDYAYNHTVALIEMAAEICKVMLQEYHKFLEDK